jgi:Yip1-like protein
MNLVGRVKAILLTPQSEWPVIEGEPGDPVYLFTNYVMYLAAIPAVCGFIGMAIVGIPLPVLGTLRISLVSALIFAIVSYLMAFVTVYVVALIIDGLAPIFGASRNFANALKLAVYSYTPVWLVGIFLLVPGLWLLRILAIYGLYLMWLGLPVLMKAPARSNMTIGYFAAIIVCAIVIGYILSRILGAIIGVAVPSF